MRHRSPYLSVAQQAFAIHALLPEAKVTLGANTRLAAIADLQPTPVSRRYTVGIDYCQGGVPEVRVLTPELALHPGAGALPHTYPDDTLCLHLPGHWRPTMFIAHTTIPWTSEWLLYYEIWLVTGQWHGGGHGTPSAGPSHG